MGNIFRDRTESALIWLFGILASFQLRHTFYFSQIGGTYFEYGSLHFYAVDFVLVGLLVLWLTDRKREKMRLGPKTILWSMVLFIGWQTLSSLWAVDKSAALWHAGEWWLWLAGYLYLINRIKSFSQILWPLGTGLFLQAGVGILQYLHNGSLGLTRLGESILNLSESGAPVVLLKNGLHQLRASGLTPHPNVLAGWLAVGFGWIVALLDDKPRQTKWVTALMAVMTVGLFLAFSRAAWVIWLVVTVIGLIWFAASKKEVRWSVGLAVLVWLVALAFNWQSVFGRFDFGQSLESKSLGDRVGAVQTFEKVWSPHLWLGVGEANYIQAASSLEEKPREAWTYQVVPNIYLLILSELGVIGLSLWLGVMVSVGYEVFIRRSRLSWWMSSGLLVWLGLGLVDHWPVSLHQGWVLWFVALALIILQSELEYKDATN